MRHIAAALAIVVALTGCTALDPYPTYPQPAKPALQTAKPARPHQPAPAPRVAICYNGLITGRAGARAAAQRQCPKGSVATPVATDYWLDYCPLLLPARATFACMSASK
jgi:hypothetical protein